MRIESVQAVCPNGYTWQGDRLVAIDDSAFARTLWESDARDLMETPTLFWDFAQLPIEREAIRSFANRYGELLEGTEEYFEEDEVRGNTIGEWSEAIQTMRYLVTIWRGIQDGDYRWLGSFIDKPHKALFRKDPHKGACKWFKNEFENPDVVIDSPMSSSKQLLERMKDVTASLDYDEETGTFETVYRACGLLPALFLQFAQSISGDKRFTFCKSCDRPIDISDDGSRVDRRFCSDRCRQRVSRRQRKKARQMRAEGEHLRTIAQRFDVDMATVKRWVGED